MSKLYTFRLMLIAGIVLLIYGACMFEANDSSIMGFLARFVIGIILCAPWYMNEVARHENKSK